ncbi:MAG: TolC family protein [Pyrinomonadaceae bacterium]|nr:TolC family protein [Pyrinomonadaceae bacterium]MBP6213484.1 TolC family protein [Pyrinomonadaceae bacterium]
MYRKLLNITLILTLLLSAVPVAAPVFAQAQMSASAGDITRYLDPVSGMTADDAVALALANNGELLAIRSEVDASRAMIRQARLRANPKLSASGTKQIGGPDKSGMAEVMLPLELGGRRAARIAVAQRELEVREFDLANQERIMAADVRLKFGEALAAIRKLDVTEKTLTAAREGYQLVTERVTEGKIAPLEQKIFLVEVNRLQSIREGAEGKVEAALFELRNMLGMKPEQILRIRGDFQNMIAPPPQAAELTERALRDRPDLQGARSFELLAAAKIEQTKSEGRIDAGVTAGYQRMDAGFPFSGYDEQGMLRPIQMLSNVFTFGIEIDLPVRNRNQGAVEAATFEREAAIRRIEFGELTIRREVASSIAKYNRAARSLSIFQGGVRDQANANLQVIWQTYELGARSLLDYIAEERRFLEVENELIEAEFETYSAHVEMLRAVNAPELKKK